MMKQRLSAVMGTVMLKNNDPVASKGDNGTDASSFSFSLGSPVIIIFNLRLCVWREGRGGRGQ